MRYRAEIDGLRAIAVVPVVLAHADFSYLPAGFLGVDIFFVISGYLITSIIYSNVESGQFSIAAFYERRARRLLPALAFMLLVVGLYGWFFFTPSELREFGKSTFATSIFMSNVFFWLMAQDYFAPGAGELHLLHTWTLGVEEQFYIVFPLLVWATYALFRLKIAVTAGVILLGLASFLTCLWLSSVAPSANFYLLPSRAWELAFGAAIALIPMSFTHGKREIFSFIGLLLIIGSYFAFDEHMGLPDWPTLVPVAGAGLLLAFSDGTMIGRMLSLRPLVWLGLISYSLYLWHQPILVIQKGILPPGWATASIIVGTAVSVVFAAISWRFIERPFRKASPNGGLIRTRLTTLIVAGLCSVTLCFTGILLWRDNGAPWRFHGTRSLHPLELKMASRQNGFCFVDFNNALNMTPSEELIACHLGSNAPGSRRILIFGDSFAGQYEPFVNHLGKTHGLNITAVTTNWCHPAKRGFRGSIEHPAFAQCDLNRKWITKHIGEFDAVMLASTWGGLARDGLLETALEYVQELNKNSIPMILFPAPHQFKKVDLDRYNLGMTDKLPVDKLTDNAQQEAFEAVRKAAGDGSVFALSRSAMFDQLGTADGLSLSKQPYSLDGAHISVFGSLLVADVFQLSEENLALSRFLSSLPKRLFERRMTATPN